ncbi:hypothetical protein NBRC116188_04960 [Oceaniserpentilla sp. 4NH20-0058]|uniref:hypothetical protein n=1 Tax=Oceaniserpentilla sp. 4NH20-0058 TaxID=3127660 RepID=UPI0031088A77
MSEMNPIVSTIVQHIMVNDNDPNAWRNELIRNHFFSAQEGKDLSDREVSLVHHALLTQKFSQMSSEQLLDESIRLDLQYHVNLESEQFQIGAIGY